VGGRSGALAAMAQTAHCGSSKSGDVAAQQNLTKQREKMFAQSDEEKRRLKDETAAYRLKNEGDRFASTTNATEVSFSQATVGLVTKEEWARRRDAAMSGEPSAETAEASAAVEGAEKKKKKKKGGGGLSFAFDDEEGEGEAVAPPKKKPKNPPPAADAASAAASSSAAAPEAATAAPAAASTAPSAPAAPPASPATKPLPAGHTCIRAVGSGALEIHCEVMSSQTLPRSRVVSVSAHAVALDVKAADKGRGEEANAALCSFVRSVLGGGGVTVEVVRGHRAPIKVLKVLGVASADLTYHRLALASNFGK